MVGGAAANCSSNCAPLLFAPSPDAAAIQACMYNSHRHCFSHTSSQSCTVRIWVTKLDFGWSEMMTNLIVMTNTFAERQNLNKHIHLRLLCGCSSTNNQEYSQLQSANLDAHAR
jgi:hypothetical protein